MKCEQCGAFVVDLDPNNPLVNDLLLCAADEYHVYRREGEEMVLKCGKHQGMEMAWNRALTLAEIAMLAEPDCGGLILPPKKSNSGD
jgi:hypothetical protein